MAQAELRRPDHEGFGFDDSRVDTITDCYDCCISPTLGTDSMVEEELV
jgi:hypothetical protein